MLTIGVLFATITYQMTVIKNMQYITRNNLWYSVLPINIATNKTFLIMVSVALMAVTAFFYLPVLMLLYIQTKNFVKNRTTNERFSRRK